MRKKKIKVVPPENIQVLPPKLPPPIKHFDPAISQLRLTQEIDERNNQLQRKQDRKNTVFTILNVLIGIGNIYLAYINVDFARQSTTASKEMPALKEQVAKLESELNLSQHRNDSIRTTVEKMQTVLKEHGIEMK